jgi:uncharacterized repeat protein (TIGR01451 family)
VASNAGPGNVPEAAIFDPVTSIHDLISDTWTATASGGATGFTPSGSGSIDDAVSIPAGGSVTYTVVATINSNATGTFSNTVSLIPLGDFTNTNPLANPGGEVSATDSDTLSAEANLAVTDTDGVSSIVAGGADTYTIVVTNEGPSSASNLSVVDTLPTQSFTSVTSPNLPSGMTFNPTTDTWTLALLGAGQSVTLELEGTVPPGATGSSYTDSVTAAASNASSVSTSDTDTLGS